ncbi:MAG: hypothetical protein NC102_07645 [Clostridium sp.]|nr:hypothetical protein [Clostridium sp.]
MTHGLQSKYPVSRIFSCLAIALLFLFSSCSKPSPAEILASADEALAQGEPQDAVAICQSLDIDALPPSQLCHSSLIYAKAAQLDGKPEHMALAAASLKKACAISVDSVTTYISSLRYPDMAVLSEVYGLCTFDSSRLPIEEEAEDIVE